MLQNSIEIQKANGEREPFDPNKLRHSLKRSGANHETQEAIIEHITGELQTGMSTTHIYRHAFSLLRKIEQKPVAARYSVRRAVFGLGPSGFPFERYVGEIFRALGYAVETGKYVKGKCALHEVDMLAYNDTEHIGAELKFHNSPGIKTDLKVALYVRERFNDIQSGPQELGKLPYVDQGMLITNTKFSKHAISYGECSGLKMLGWNYPKKGHLEDLIEKTGVYPITSLTGLTQHQKLSLISNNIVVCNELEGKVSELEKAGIKKEKITTIIEESQALCTLRDTA